ncbi:MFS transporter [Clostridium tertium]|nr:MULTISPECIES: MFS transporter [Clostridium]MBS5884183.1 MFS transporter [Clostridium sp.]MDB1924211.1 MFS transporter [Clostridium tertium]MDB1927254.1 MFS transporter [Clostridium tertium]MDB1929283.1 MFS transporter [Clostridium tertium]MDB1932084.1 MFS transporter [Clostridium tertium]
MTFTYKHTMYASFIGYIVQAIINNFIPLLFLTFQSSYNIPISKITFLVTFNFGFQLLIDFLSAGFIDKIGYRLSVIIAHICAGLGLISLTILPEIFSDPFIGLLISVMIYAIGGGLIEVLISPIVEACPTDNKEAAMSLLHSFYCWGHVSVVLISTIFFSVFGILNWKYLAIFWSLIPIFNIFLFIKVPILHLIEDGENSLTVKELLSNKIFWLMILLMICAGASEQSVSQWASTFAEKTLNGNKALGDLAGPMFFAIMMGISRTIYGKLGEKINLKLLMIFCSLLCFISYIIISLSPWPLLSLIGCGICGFSVGILWPGTFSISSSILKKGGTALFAFLALAGDVGCSLGPTIVGRLSSIFNDNIKIGILFSSIFPILLIIGIILSGINKKIKFNNI